MVDRRRAQVKLFVRHDPFRPAPLTIVSLSANNKNYQWRRGSNSVVECQLPKLDVAGSTPVSRSIKFFSHSFLILLSRKGAKNAKGRKEEENNT
jgi:hypothetical protein